MGATPSPELVMSSLLGQYQTRTGNVVTEGSLSFPLVKDEDSTKSPILNLQVDTDFKARVVATLDLGPTNPVKDFSRLPSHFTDGVPLFIDPGWLALLKGGTPQDQVAWGGKLLVRHVIIRCVLGAVSLQIGGLDPFGDYPVNPPAKTRPFILQEGGVFSRSFNGTRPFTVVVNPGGADTPRPFVQGLPDMLLQTFEDLNRIRVAVFVERYD